MVYLFSCQKCHEVSSGYGIVRYDWPLSTHEYDKLSKYKKNYIRDDKYYITLSQAGGGERAEGLEEGWATIDRRAPSGRTGCCT